MKIADEKTSTKRVTNYYGDLHMTLLDKYYYPALEQIKENIALVLRSQKVKDNAISQLNNSKEYNGNPHTEGPNVLLRKALKDDCGVSIEATTFSSFINGKRLNLSVLMLFSQHTKVPLSEFLGPRFAEIEKNNITNKNFSPIRNLETSSYSMCVPGKQEKTHLRQHILPNDIDNFKTGQLCIIDIRKPTSYNNEIYLVHVKNKIQALKIKSEAENMTVIGKVQQVLVDL